MYNKVLIIGRLVRDPEMKLTAAGIAVTRFTVAVDKQVKKDKESGEQTADFLRVVAWRRLAEICNEYLKKGKLVAIEGRLQFSSYEKDGEKRSSAEIIADNMQMLDRVNQAEMATEPA